MKRIAFLLLGSSLALPLSAQVPQIPLKIYAQQLVDETAAKNPDLLVIMMHVTPDKSPNNVIIASNIGRTGKKKDDD